MKSPTIWKPKRRVGQGSDYSHGGLSPNPSINIFIRTESVNDITLIIPILNTIFTCQPIIINVTLAKIKPNRKNATALKWFSNKYMAPPSLAFVVSKCTMPQL